MWLMWESRGLVTYVKANTNTFIINIFILLVFAAQETLSKHASRTFTGWTWEAQKRNYQLVYSIHLLVAQQKIGLKEEILSNNRAAFRCSINRGWGDGTHLMTYTLVTEIASLKSHPQQETAFSNCSFLVAMLVSQENSRNTCNLYAFLYLLLTCLIGKSVLSPGFTRQRPPYDPWSPCLVWHPLKHGQG